ncbi:MAG: uracil phosphoribosyltransferase [Cyclobacteriaceae bacterium]
MTQHSQFVLSETASVAHQFLADLRQPEVQSDRMRFRRNLERIGEILAYELSKVLSYESSQIETPLGTAQASLLKQQPVLVSVLRAGLPLHQGVLNYFDLADNGFVGAYRQVDQTADSGFTIQFDYESIPDLQNRPLILIDPMLASGRTLVKAVKQLKRYGNPSQVHIVSVIAAPEGITNLKNELGENFSLWLGAIDDHLNEKSYIVPGLGDAGDLAFGLKK